MIVRSEFRTATAHRKTRVLALVLAAGQARRFGSDKRFARLPGGEPLLACTLTEVSRAFGAALLVVREGDLPELTAGFGTPVSILPSARAARGLGYSIADGMQALVRVAWAADALSVAIILGDMPWVAAETYRTLARHAGAANILRPAYRGEPGHPVLFGRDFWPLLCGLEAAEGARQVLRRHASAVSQVPVDDPGVLQDVDRPEDLLQPAGKTP